jgi:DNA-directed RNA polymerase alpha subunit
MAATGPEGVVSKKDPVREGFWCSSKEVAVERSRLVVTEVFRRMALAHETDEIVEAVACMLVEHRPKAEVEQTLRSLRLRWESEHVGNSRVLAACDGLFIRVEDLALSVRAVKALSSMNVHMVGELVQLTKREMLDEMCRSKNFGRKSMKEIEEALTNMGLHFGMQVDHWPLMLERHEQQLKKDQRGA